MFLFHLSKCLGMELVVHEVCIYFYMRLPTTSQTGNNVLRSHQQCMRVSVALPPCQHLVLSGFFFILSHSNRCTAVSCCGFNLLFSNAHDLSM